MLVADLEHFLDLPDGIPAAARRLAGRLGAIVRAATSGERGTAWVSALPCPRRPGNRACAGRMIVHWPGQAGPIGWQCNTCGDEGVVSNWADSPYDLRRRILTGVGRVREVVVSMQTAAVLRDLLFLGPDTERAVYAMRGEGEDVVLAVSDDELEELIGSVAAQANHELNRRRQKHLDAVLAALDDVARGA